MDTHTSKAAFIIARARDAKQKDHRIHQISKGIAGCQPPKGENTFMQYLYRRIQTPSARDAKQDPVPFPDSKCRNLALKISCSAVPMLPYPFSCSCNAARRLQ